MERHLVPLRLLLLRLLLSAPAVSSSPAVSSLFARADMCAAEGLMSCSKDFPDNFCCPKNNSCISLAGGTTVLCCPNGSSCVKIHPITCNIRAQDPNFPPDNLKAPIKTTALDAALPKCAVGGYCCPFGYSCSDHGTECSRNKDQSQPPKPKQQPSASPATSAEPSATSTTSDSPSSAAAASATPNDVSDPGPAPGPGKGALIGGIAGGVVGLIMLVAVVILCLRRRRRTASDQDSMQEQSTAGAGGPYGHVISAPVMHPGSYRSDFLRGNPASPEPPAASYSPSNTHLRPGPRISIPNPFDSPNPSPYSPPRSPASVTSVEEMAARTGHVIGSRLAPIRAMKPTEARYSRRMSTDGRAREPAYEDINVFADPDTVRSSRSDRPITTMSEMMDEVGLGDVHRGRRPYVPGTTPRI